MFLIGLQKEGGKKKKKKRRELTWHLVYTDGDDGPQLYCYAAIVIEKMSLKKKKRKEKKKKKRKTNNEIGKRKEERNREEELYATRVMKISMKRELENNTLYIYTHLSG